MILDNLTEQLKEVRSAFLPIIADSILAYHYFMGKTISESKEFIEQGKKGDFYIQLSNELRYSEITLRKEVQFYSRFPQIGLDDATIDVTPIVKELKTDKISWSKVSKIATNKREVKELPEPTEKDQSEIIREVQTVKVSINKLVKEIRRLKIKTLFSEGYVFEILNTGGQEIGDLVIAFYGKTTNITETEFKYAKLLLQSCDFEEVCQTIIYVKTNDKSNNFHIRNCKSIRYLYQYYPEITDQNTKKSIPTKEEWEKYAEQFNQ